MESKGPPSFFFCAPVVHAQLSQTHQASKQYNASGGASADWEVRLSWCW